MKKNYFIASLFIILVIVIFFYFKFQGKYILQSNEEQIIRIAGNTNSLDATIDVQIISHSSNGKLSLSGVEIWYDINQDVRYNITTENVEKWYYDSKSQKSEVKILSNFWNGIEVNKDMIIMNVPNNVTFGFNSKTDFFIKIKNVSDTPIVFEIQKIYR